MPWLALAGLSFCRLCELTPQYAGDEVLQWQNVLLDRPTPLRHIRAEVAKQTLKETGVTRYPPITDAAMHWLRPHLRTEGPIVPFMSSRQRMEPLGSTFAGDRIAKTPQRRQALQSGGVFIYTTNLEAFCCG